eukprot:c19758_g3_i1 orf=1-162(-)
MAKENPRLYRVTTAWDPNTKPKPPPLFHQPPKPTNGCALFHLFCNPNTLSLSLS